MTVQPLLGQVKFVRKITVVAMLAFPIERKKTGKAKTKVINGCHARRSLVYYCIRLYIPYILRTYSESKSYLGRVQTYLIRERDFYNARTTPALNK